MRACWRILCLWEAGVDLDLRKLIWRMNYTWKRGSSRQKDQLDGYCNSLKCGDETRRRKIQKINKRKNGSVQFSSAAQSCPTLCDPMESSMPGLPVCHQLPELTHTHVDQVGDAIQPSHPLSSPPPPAFNLSQHKGLFRWVSSSHQVAKVWKFQLQRQSFQWIFRTDFLQDWLI